MNEQPEDIVALILKLQAMALLLEAQLHELYIMATEGVCNESK